MLGKRSLINRALGYGTVLLLVQSLAGCSEKSGALAEAERANAREPAGQPSQPVEDGPLVLAFGDSLFAGYGLGPSEGLAPALDRALDRAGVAAAVVNAGASGDTSAAGRQRLAFTLDGQPRKPALVIVGLGGNDMLRGIDPDVTRDNLDGILAELERRGIPALLSGMIAAPNLGADYARAFNVIYPDLAAKYDVPLYPFTLDGVIGRPGFMLGDNIHPSARGVEEMARRMAPLVGTTLAAPAP